MNLRALSPSSEIVVARVLTDNVGATPAEMSRPEPPFRARAAPFLNLGRTNAPARSDRLSPAGARRRARGRGTGSELTPCCGAETQLRRPRRGRSAGAHEPSKRGRSLRSSRRAPGGADRRERGAPSRSIIHARSSWLHRPRRGRRAARTGRARARVRAARRGGRGERACRRKRGAPGRHAPSVEPRRGRGGFGVRRRATALQRDEPARELMPFVAAGARAPVRSRCGAWRRHALDVWLRRGARRVWSPPAVRRHFAGFARSMEGTAFTGRRSKPSPALPNFRIA
jgi:hypothetical protein